VRTDCLVDRVMVADAGQPCRYARLGFIDDSQNNTKLADGSVTVRDATGATVFSTSVSKGSWPSPVINVPKCLSLLDVEWRFNVDDAVSTPMARQVSGVWGTGDCDGEVHIVPENQLTYLIRYTLDPASVIAEYTDIQVIIDNGPRSVSAGPLAPGGTIWIDLGPCNTVANFTVMYAYIIDPTNSTPYTASPDPGSPRFPAVPGCLDPIFDHGPMPAP
jgi:hypothetical protein